MVNDPLLTVDLPISIDSCWLRVFHGYIIHFATMVDLVVTKTKLLLKQIETHNNVIYNIEHNALCK